MPLPSDRLAELRGLLGEPEAARFLRLGHFAYEGGDHGDTSLALELLFADPRRLQRAAARLATRLRPYGADLVCGPLIGGALVGQAVACELGVAFVYAEPRAGRSAAGAGYAVPVELRQGLVGKRAIIVDDAINAGSAALACLRELESLGGRPVAVASLIVRQSAEAALRQRVGVPFEAIVAVPWNTWPASECPLCRAGVELSPLR